MIDIFQVNAGHKTVLLHQVMNTFKLVYFRCLYKTCLLNSFKFIDILNFLFFWFVVNMLEMYSRSKCSACSVTEFCKSFPISLKIAFTSSWQRRNSGGSVFKLTLYQTLHENLSQHLNVFVSSVLRRFSAFMVVSGKVLFVGATNFDNMVFGLTSKKAFHVIVSGVFTPFFFIYFMRICLFRFWEGLSQLRWYLGFIRLGLKVYSNKNWAILICKEHKSF